MLVNERELKERTMQLALRVIRVSREIESLQLGRPIANQLLRSGTSVAANYRAACRARSRADMISKLGIVEEEADETAFWLELIIRSNMQPSHMIEPLLAEVNEIVAIMVASRKTLKQPKQ